ncbi:(S)-ureidoglycine aminohydrolase [Terriglobus tenax]|uniref:(S)-ureidoglycine aminohydrolase n=1 Tax=Terriglobus tenax TaxID=1111115 RepID=UPI0021DF49CA|nr:(S)-ureidoglycine aminohydrolase [Terriglobus tenax]
MFNLGHSRSRTAGDHFLLTADTFIRAALPGMTNATAIVHVSPAVGAAFTQYTAELAANGSLGPAAAQRFVYVLEGSVVLSAEDSTHTLNANGYAYIPEDLEHSITSTQPAKLAVIEKKYQVLDGVEAPGLFIGDETRITPTALNGDEDLAVRTLLPGDSSFDFAVNTMGYVPGATLAQTEIHVMEHGLLMLTGGGIYKLGDQWYPVTAGDFIYMAPFCPQWFGALGKQPAKYLIYKDWNRHPLA